MKVDGYTTEITYKGDRQYSITVTNTKNWFDSLLPEIRRNGKSFALHVRCSASLLSDSYGIQEEKKHKKSE